MSEAKFYNALNVYYKGDYGELKKCWDQFQNWEKGWSVKKANFDVEKEWQKLKDQKISLILKEDESYPKLLREISFPSFGLYLLGNFQYSQPAVAIVGTRSATPQGKELARQFASALSQAGLTVISGLALGIDAAAHQGALDGGGKTIAVLGTPLNHIYPRQNERLAKEILKNGGAIISEFPFNQEYHPQNFLIRNRIISGLSNAILIIEAPERSGALATAKFALEQNREVLAVPGNITAQNYKGSNALIKAGATPVTSPEDILDYFQIEKPASPKTELETDSSDNPILKVLKKKGELTLEQILNESLLEISELNKNLGALVIKGIIKESNGKYYLL